MTSLNNNSNNSSSNSLEQDDFLMQDASELVGRDPSRCWNCIDDLGADNEPDHKIDSTKGYYVCTGCNATLYPMRRLAAMRCAPSSTTTASSPCVQLDKKTVAALAQHNGVNLQAKRSCGNPSCLESDIIATARGEGYVCRSCGIGCAEAVEEEEHQHSRSGHTAISPQKQRRYEQQEQQQQQQQSQSGRRIRRQTPSAALALTPFVLPEFRAPVQIVVQMDGTLPPLFNRATGRFEPQTLRASARTGVKLESSAVSTIVSNWKDKSIQMMPVPISQQYQDKQHSLLLDAYHDAMVFMTSGMILSPREAIMKLALDIILFVLLKLRQKENDTEVPMKPEQRKKWASLTPEQQLAQQQALRQRSRSLYGRRYAIGPLSAAALIIASKAYGRKIRVQEIVRRFNLNFFSSLARAGTTQYVSASDRTPTDFTSTRLPDASRTLLLTAATYRCESDAMKAETEEEEEESSDGIEEDGVEEEFKTDAQFQQLYDSMLAAAKAREAKEHQQQQQQSIDSDGTEEITLSQLEEGFHAVAASILQANNNNNSNSNNNSNGDSDDMKDVTSDSKKRKRGEEEDGKEEEGASEKDPKRIKLEPSSLSSSSSSSPLSLSSSAVRATASKKISLRAIPAPLNRARVVQREREILGLLGEGNSMFTRIVPATSNELKNITGPWSERTLPPSVKKEGDTKDDSKATSSSSSAAASPSSISSSKPLSPGASIAMTSVVYPKEHMKTVLVYVDLWSTAFCRTTAQRPDSRDLYQSTSEWTKLCVLTHWLQRAKDNAWLIRHRKLGLASGNRDTRSTARSTQWFETFMRGLLMYHPTNPGDSAGFERFLCYIDSQMSASELSPVNRDKLVKAGALDTNATVRFVPEPNTYGELFFHLGRRFPSSIAATLMWIILSKRGKGKNREDNQLTGDNYGNRKRPLSNRTKLTKGNKDATTAPAPRGSKYRSVVARLGNDTFVVPNFINAETIVQSDFYDSTLICSTTLTQTADLVLDLASAWL